MVNTGLRRVAVGQEPATLAAKRDPGCDVRAVLNVEGKREELLPLIAGVLLVANPLNDSHIASIFPNGTQTVAKVQRRHQTRKMYSQLVPCCL